MKLGVAGLCVGVLLSSSLLAQDKATKLRGTVVDAATKRPVGGATVSASGDTAQQSELTDDSGFFRILIEGVAPGDLVRIRVTKAGYAVYDRQIVSSEEIPISVELRRLGSGPTVAVPPKKAGVPVKSSNPVTARYIEQLKSDPDWQARLHALQVVAENAAKDDAAIAAICAAVTDQDYRVRDLAVQEIGYLKPASKDAVTSLLIALNDISSDVRAYAVLALGRFPQSKEGVAALFRVMGSPPEVNANAAILLSNMKIDDPRILAALIYEGTVAGDKEAGKALTNRRGDKRTMDALFAALGAPPGINIKAMNLLLGMGVDNPRLIAALIYQATVKGDVEAVGWLGKFPKNTDAVAALFAAMGGASPIDVAAMTTLDDMGTDDPRLTKALLAKATRYDQDAAARMLKKAPFSQELIARVVADLTEALDRPENYLAQNDVILLLRGGGAAGRDALHHLLASLDAAHQMALVLAWLEGDRGAAAEVPQYVRAPELQASLLKAEKVAAFGTVSLPEYRSLDTPCNEAPSLRATMGLAVLNLAPKDHAVKTMIQNVDASVDACAMYAAAVVGWLGPANGKAASEGLVHVAHCRDGTMAQTAAMDTMALIGTQATIDQLMMERDEYYCDSSHSPYHLSSERRDELIGRIRGRLGK